MALPSFLASEVYGTTLALLRSQGDKYGGPDGLTLLARDVFRRYGGVNSGRNYAEYRSVVNQANAAYEAGLMLGPGMGAPEPPRSNLIPAGQPQYEYRVLVGEGGPRGRGAETVLVIRSDEPLDYAAIRAEALDTVENMTPQSTDSAGRRGLAGTTPETVIVLTAAQQG